MKCMRLAAFLILAGAAGSASAVTLASSSFDASDEGWSAVNGARDFEWRAEGGDPDGHISARDFSGDTLWFFAAPSSFLGNQAGALGGALSFSLKLDSSSVALSERFAGVQLLGRNGVRLAFDGDIDPGSDWATFTIPLVADGSWRLESVAGDAATAADLAGVLGDLADLRIRGDYRQRDELTALDNVVLTAVPEPGTLALLIGGLAVVARASRRR
jgi:hypothetical protein